MELDFKKKYFTCCVFLCVYWFPWKGQDTHIKKMKLEDFQEFVKEISAFMKDTGMIEQPDFNPLDAEEHRGRISQWMQKAKGENNSLPKQCRIECIIRSLEFVNSGVLQLFSSKKLTSFLVDVYKTIFLYEDPTGRSSCSTIEGIHLDELESMISDILQGQQSRKWNRITSYHYYYGWIMHDHHITQEEVDQFHRIIHYMSLFGFWMYKFSKKSSHLICDSWKYYVSCISATKNYSMDKLLELRDSPLRKANSVRDFCDILVRSAKPDDEEDDIEQDSTVDGILYLFQFMKMMEIVYPDEFANSRVFRFEEYCKEIHHDFHNSYMHNKGIRLMQVELQESPSENGTVLVLNPFGWS
jgi:hypothetical protein